jgi:hypothetical protein
MIAKIYKLLIINEISNSFALKTVKILRGYKVACEIKTQLEKEDLVFQLSIKTIQIIWQNIFSFTWDFP